MSRGSDAAMKKKLLPLLAGALALSVLVSSCGAQVESPSPSPTETPEVSGSLESRPLPTVTPTPAEETASAEVETSASGAVEEPFQVVESTDVPIASAAPPKVDVVTQAPVISTPKPVVSTPAPTVPTPAPETVVPAVSAAPPVTTPAPTPPVATKEAASAFIGQSVSSLIAAIGQPLSQGYAPSCLGSGKDGELIYDGFTVYTYREGGTEIVQDVI